MKWCSTGKKHKTVLRLVEIGDRKYVVFGAGDDV